MNEDVEAHVLERYELIQRLGKGAYGIVWKAMDKKYRQVVALKKVFDAFRNSTDAQRTYREVIFLQDLNGHDNIVRLRNIIKAENNMDLYLVFEYMEADLHMVIRAGILEDVHKRYIIYQILKALKYVHSAELIHRDLKPANVLINSDVLIKVADFGLARSIAFTGDDADYRLSEYIATRWYRAPEILMGSCRYTKAVDVWSVGCILGELMVGKPIFQGKSSLNQIEKVLELVGRPKPEDLEAIDSPHAETILNSLAATKKKAFQQMFPEANEEALDLLRRMLTFNPLNRITIDEALKHKYVIQFSNPKEEIVCPNVIEVPLNDFMKLSMKEYREAIYSQIAKKKRERRKKIQEKSTGVLMPSDGSDKRSSMTPQSPKASIVKGDHNDHHEKPQQLSQSHYPQEPMGMHKKSTSSLSGSQSYVQTHHTSASNFYQPQTAYPQVQQPHQQPHHHVNNHSQSQHPQTPQQTNGYAPQMKSEKRRNSLVPSNRQHTRSVTQSQLPSGNASPSHTLHSPIHNTNASPIYSRLQSSTMLSSATSGAKLRPYKAYEKSFSSQVKSSMNTATSSSMMGGDETNTHSKYYKDKDVKSPTVMERKPQNPGSASKVRYVIVNKPENENQLEGGKEPIIGKPMSNSPQRMGQPGRKAYFVVDPAAKNMFRSTSSGMTASKVMSTTGNSFILKKK